MIPILPLLLLLRLLFNLTSEANERRVARQQGRPVTRATRRQISPGLGRTLWFLAAWFFILPGALVILGGITQGQWTWTPVLPICAAILFPWLMTRWILIPLRQPTLARGLSLLPTWTWRKDRWGGAALAGAWALLRSRKPRPATVKRLETSLEQCKPLRAAGVAANGLLAASRGDLEKARLLLATVEQVHPSARPAAAVRIAREWLSVDAAERGDWDLAARLGRLAGPRSRLTRLIGAVGSRLVRAPKAPGPLSIWALWALAPHRLVAFPWVRRALAPASPRSREKRVAVPFPTVAGLDALGAAVSTHAAVIERGASLPPAQLVRALKAWDRAFEDPGVMGRVQQRAAALAVPFPETVLFEMRRDVLAELMRASFRGVVPLRLLPEAGLGLEIADQLRQELLGAVERAVESLHRRLEEKGARPLPAGDELAEWLTLRAACERAGRLGGEELRRISFAIVQSEVCNHAVWLYNVRRETPVANVIMTWLLSEAEAVGDAEAVEFHRRNVQIGI